MTTTPYRLPGHNWIPEPELSFHPELTEQRDLHPLRGLCKFGPLSKPLLGDRPIRLAAIYPEGWRSGFADLLAELTTHHRPNERKQYLVEYPGFSEVFKSRIKDAGRSFHREIPTDIADQLAQADRPHVMLADELMSAIRDLEASRTEFDVLLIYLPEAWEAGFEGGEEDDFDLHDYLKAHTAIRRMPIQIVRDREGGALEYSNRASVMWRLSIALYTKAGGVPWRIAGTGMETAYVGISYALKEEGREKSPEFVTCCSQVFDADGTGLEFLAFETQPADVEHKNPFLTREDMRRLMARSLQLYQDRHAGQKPERVVVHKNSQFKDAEIDGAFEALGSADAVELVQVVQDVGWRGVKIDSRRLGRRRGGRGRGRSEGKRGKATGYPVERGSYLTLSGTEALLWTQGNVSEAFGTDFYKEGKSIPNPLMLRRFAGQGGWQDECASVLGLTKMDWNNDSLYNRLPVTLSYASEFARLAKRIPDLAYQAYPFRFFM